VPQFKRDPPPAVSGPAEFAARARTRPDGDVWFTIGQGWAFEEDGQRGYTVRLTMTPTNWDGELLLVPIPREREDGAEPAH
jgi:hypothetical protein